MSRSPEHPQRSPQCEPGSVGQLNLSKIFEKFYIISSRKISAKHWWFVGMQRLMVLSVPSFSRVAGGLR